MRFGNLSLGLTRRVANAIQAIYEQTAGAAEDFGATDWNPDAFTAYASLTRATATGYNADEMQIYIGSDNYQHRVMIQIDNDTNRTMRVRVEKDNVETLTQDYTLNNRFMAKTMKFAVTWDGSELYMYLNGYKLMIDNDCVMPTSVAGICVGKATDGAAAQLATSATSIDFKYYNVTLSDSQVRNLCRNTNLLDGITYDVAKKGIFTFGQSNIKGPTTLNNTPSYTNSSLIKNLALDGQYKAYSDPHMDNTNNLFGGTILDATGAGTSYIGYVLDDLAEDGNEYYVVGSAEGGTDQASDWKVYDTGSNADSLMNNLSMAACTRMLMGMQAGDMIAMVNHQGESDAQAGTSESVYKDNFTELVAELRAVRGANIPLIIVGLHEWDAATGVSETNWNNIDLWRSELAASISNAAFVDISDIPARSGDEFHIGATDHSDLGTRVSNAIQAMV